MLSYLSPARDSLKKTETLWMYQKLIPEKLNLSVSLKALKGREKNDNFFRACFTVDCFKESCLLFVDTMS